MIRKVPIIRPRISYRDIVLGLGKAFKKSVYADFSADLARSFGSQQVYLTNSGISAFYLILLALKKTSARSEVILPAYTAGSLVVAVKKAGLKPVLCDISLEDFNLDTDSLGRIISEKTLAVVIVHMFGIALAKTPQIRQSLPKGVYLLEDCCQAMASRIMDKPVGSFADVSFFSFKRGKNFPLFGGGCIVSYHPEVSQELEGLFLHLPAAGFLSALARFIQALEYKIGTDPYVYGLCFPLISRFKETVPPEGFPVAKINRFEAGLGNVLMKNADQLFLSRFRKGKRILEGLKDLPHIRLPKISPQALAVFNRLPILCKDREVLARMQKRLWQQGIDSSRMYLRPLHHKFELGYSAEDFPNAVYLAEHLLTLPVYPGLSEKDITRMIQAIKDTA